MRPQDDDVVGLDEAEHIARNLFDEIGMRLCGRQQRNVAFKFAANGLETARFERQQTGALDEPRTRLKAMPAVHRVVTEVGHETQAEKHYRSLPKLRPPIVVWLTQQDADSHYRHILTAVTLPL